MFFPISTDAPVYHWPFATVGLIAANLGVFACQLTGVLGPEDGVILHHGAGLRPIEWLLSMFAHGGFEHIFGNMVFLWVFGLVVEGKLGWRRFLACYLFIGVGESAVEQVLMLGAEGGGSLGASTAIYGIMAMAAVWAPKNEVTFFYWIFIFSGTFDVAIGFLCGLYVGLDVLTFVLSGGIMSTAWLHVAGAVIGFPLGILMLKRNMVDCEGWDMFHVWKGDYGAVAEQQAKDEEAVRRSGERRKKQLALQAEEGHDQLRKYLADGNALAALRLCDILREQGNELELDAGELRRFVAGLHQAGKWAESAPYMDRLIRLEEEAEEAADLLRVKLAQICVVELDRPGRALDLLQQARAQGLSEPEQKLAIKVARRAQQMQAEGLVELDDGQW